MHTVQFLIGVYCLVMLIGFFVELLQIQPGKNRISLWLLKPIFISSFSVARPSASNHWRGSSAWLSMFNHSVIVYRSTDLWRWISAALRQRWTWRLGSWCWSLLASAASLSIRNCLHGLHSKQEYRRWLRASIPLVCISVHSLLECEIMKWFESEQVKVWCDIKLTRGWGVSPCYFYNPLFF